MAKVLELECMVKIGSKIVTEVGIHFLLNSVTFEVVSFSKKENKILLLFSFLHLPYN